MSKSTTTYHVTIKVVSEGDYFNHEIHLEVEAVDAHDMSEKVEWHMESEWPEIGYVAKWE